MIWQMARAVAPKNMKSILRRGALLLPFGVLALGLSATLARAQDDVTVTHGIATFGEIGYPADFPHLSYVNPDAPKGGEISIWAFGSFDSMHPYTPKGRAGGMSSAFFESMMVGVADEIGTSYCLICTTLEYPEDRSWVIFNLRDDVTFSDGSPLTAEDVVFSYELFRDKGLPSFRAVLQTQVETAEILSPTRIKYTFKADIPTRDLPDTMGGLPIFSKAHYVANDRDFEESSLEPLLGSGPYVLDELDVGQSIVYRLNPNYWAKDHPLSIGQYNFETIRVEYYADYNAAFEGFKGGTYTFRNEASSKSWATGYDFPAVEAGHVVKAELPDGTIATGQSFIFNLRREKFQDPLVREAIGLMFNFEWSNETLFYGIYDRITSFWENTDLAATGVPSAGELAILEPLAEILPEGVLTEEAVMPATSGARQLDRGNLRRASALLDQAGWIVGDDGIRRKNGVTLTVEFLNDSQTFDRIINPFIENLRRLGIEAAMVRVDNAQMTQRERSYDFDMITHQMPMSYIPGSGLQQYFGSASADTSVFNLMGLRDPGVDALIKVVEDAKTQEELTVAVHALDRVLRAHRFWVPQWFKPAHTVAYYDYYEHPAELPPYSLGQLTFWWANMDKYNALKAAGAF